MGNKSHYDPTHKRVFVREISGEYSLKHELKRLRELPRVQKGEHGHVPVGAAGVLQALHGARRRARADAAHPPRGVRAGRQVADARPRERGDLLHPRRQGLRDPRRHQVRLESRRHRGRAQQLRAPAQQRRRARAGARARHQDEADVHVHEHALPAARHAAPDRADADAGRFRAARGRRRTTSRGTHDHDHDHDRTTTITRTRTRTRTRTETRRDDGIRRVEELARRQAASARSTPRRCSDAAERPDPRRRRARRSSRPKRCRGRCRRTG